MLATPDTRSQLDAMGADPMGSTPERMRQQIDTEVKRFGDLAKKAKLQLV